MEVKKNIIFFLITIMGLIGYSSDVLAASDINWLWARSGGGAGDEAPWKVAVDSTGNVYTIGWFPGTIAFGSTALTSKGDWDVFLCKYDAAGNLIWAKSYGGSGKEEGLGITIDREGNLYIAGYFMETTSFGAFTVTSRGDRDVFLAKCDSNGNILWFVSDGGSGLDFAQDVALDAKGNVYMTGMFSGSATFGSQVLTSSGAQDAFVAKYDTAGNFIWVTQLGGSGDNGLSWPTGDRGFSIAVDNSGNSYSTGQFNGVANFGGKALISNGAEDIYVTKIDPLGNLEWAIRGGGSNADLAQAIALDGPQKNICVAGEFHNTATFGSSSLTSYGGNDAFLVKIDTSGNVLWARNGGGGSDDYGLGTAIDEEGNYYISGAYTGTVTFGTMNISGAGGLDIFLARYDSSGIFDTILTATEPSDDISNDVRSDRKGNIYVCGFFQNTVSLGSNTITSNGGRDIFFGKLKLLRKRNAIVATTIAGFPTLTCDSVTFSDAKIWNTGTDTLHITNITITQNNEGFSIASSLSYPIILTPGSDTIISIRFAPATTGPKTAMLNIFSDASNTQTLSAQLSGERDVPATITASISIAAFSGSPGDTVKIPVIIRSLQQALLSGMSYTARVSYDGTVLLPVRIKNGTMDSSGNGYVVFTVNSATDTVILICIVGLGDSVNTTIHVDTIEWGGCTVQSTSQDGTFQLQGLCTQGSTRLFTANGSLMLAQNVPNPFTGETMIRYSTIEDGETELYVTDVLGRRVETLLAGYRKAGQYTAEFNGGELRSGIYYYALQTPTQIFRKTMVVEK